MKKILFLFAFLAATPALLLAHPPKKMQMSYEDGKLIIEAKHPVKDVEDHYIDNITIWVDDAEVKVIEPSKQTSLKAEKIEIELPGLKKGSVVKVKMSCNKFGAKSASLELE
jgi:hypothetical protein